MRWPKDASPSKSPGVEPSALQTPLIPKRTHANTAIFITSSRRRNRACVIRKFVVQANFNKVRAERNGIAVLQDDGLH